MLWLLAMYFIGVLILLLNEVLRKLDLVFGPHSAERSGKENVEVMFIRVNFVLVAICFHIYTAFLLAVKLEAITTKTRRGGKGHTAALYM